MPSLNSAPRRRAWGRRQFGLESPDGAARRGQVLQWRAWLRLHQTGRRRARRVRPHHGGRVGRIEEPQRRAAHQLRCRARQEGQGTESGQSRGERLTRRRSRRRAGFDVPCAAGGAIARGTQSSDVRSCDRPSPDGSSLPMMTLHSSPASPFVRKVRIAIALLELGGRVGTREADLNDPAGVIRRDNPLGKIPALVREDGGVLYDSRVILEYLDHLGGGGRIVPREAEARFAALTLQALCDGALDASVLIVYEGRYRPKEMQVSSWIERQAGKVERALAALENTARPLTGTPHVGEIALACLLGYRDFRFDGSWRQAHPRLHAWHDAFAAAVPAFAATAPA